MFIGLLREASEEGLGYGLWVMVDFVFCIYGFRVTDLIFWLQVLSGVSCFMFLLLLMVLPDFE